MAVECRDAAERVRKPIQHQNNQFLITTVALPWAEQAKQHLTHKYKRHLWSECCCKCMKRDTYEEIHAINGNNR
jgi:hypothetical protein